MQVAESPATLAGDGVVAFGIGGDEARGPGGVVRRYLPLRQGSGPAPDRACRRDSGTRFRLERAEIGAERIGHGIRADRRPGAGAAPGGSRGSRWKSASPATC